MAKGISEKVAVVGFRCRHAKCDVAFVVKGTPPKNLQTSES